MLRKLKPEPDDEARVALPREMAAQRGEHLARLALHERERHRQAAHRLLRHRSDLLPSSAESLRRSWDCLHSPLRFQ